MKMSSETLGYKKFEKESRIQEPEWNIGGGGIGISGFDGFDEAGRSRTPSDW